MIDVVGAFLQEVLDTVSVKIFLNNLTMQTTLRELLVPISLLCKGLTGLMTAMWLQCSVHQTIATDAVTRLQLWQ